MTYLVMVRKRIVALAPLEGMKTKQIAALFGICHSWVATTFGRTRSTLWSVSGGAGS